MACETVLIIEDDPTLLRGLKDNYEYAGYRVLTAIDGEEGLDAALNKQPDLIILDIMLPEMNGYEICRVIREEDLTMPIIMLTAKSQESDIILGLNLGANDYVTKPFSIKELLARTNALLRGKRRDKTEAITFGDCELDLSSMKLLRGGREIELAPKEFALLGYFLDNANRALTRDQLLNKVWGYEVTVTSRSVDRCVNTLRRKLEEIPRRPQFIKTVREIGYRFEKD